MMGTKPVCVPCGLFYKHARSGVYFIEGMPKTSAPHDLPRDPEQWKPYKVWVSDLYECRGCGNQILVGMPAGPTAEHYQDGFSDWVERATVTVNDC